MNEFKILWIDDYWEPGHNAGGFEVLNAIKNDILKDDQNITINTKYSLTGGYTAFFRDKSFDYSLLIVDLNFEASHGRPMDDEPTVKEIVMLAKEKSLPVMVFSSYANDAPAKIDAFMDSPLLLGVYNKSDKIGFINAVLNTAQFKPLNIVHITDFHYDSALTGNYKTEQTERFEEMINCLKKEHEKWKIDLIVFSGDFAYKHPKEDFLQCYQIIQKIVTLTVKDFSRLLIIPGNHDIEWADFEKAILADRPGFHFYDFLSKIYTNDHEIISNLYGYNTDHSEFSQHFEPDDFSWSKTFTNLNLEVIGLNTVTTQPEILGLGKVSEKMLRFIKRKWENPARGQNLRLAILHHNILPPFSIDTLAESKNILNAGAVVDLLATKGCNVIMSGHCHDSYLYNFSYAVVNHNGFSEMRHLSYLSTGTTGGYVGSLDRARSFSLISILPSREKKKNNLIVVPLFYDSKDRKWIKGNELNASIVK